MPRLRSRAKQRRRPPLVFLHLPWDSRRQSGRRETASPSCPTRPTSLLSSPFPLLIPRCLTPTPVMCCLFLHELHAVFCAHRQTHTYKDLCVHVTIACCAVLHWWACHASSASSEWQWRPSILPQRLSFMYPNTLSYPPHHSAPTGGNVASSMDSQPPLSSWMLSSHIALAEPSGRLWDATNFV